jgi:hypothetical protein
MRLVDKKERNVDTYMLHLPYFVVMTLLHADENFKMSDEKQINLLRINVLVPNPHTSRSIYTTLKHKHKYCDMCECLFY